MTHRSPVSISMANGRNGSRFRCARIASSNWVGAIIVSPACSPETRNSPCRSCRSNTSRGIDEADDRLALEVTPDLPGAGADKHAALLRDNFRMMDLDAGAVDQLDRKGGKWLAVQKGPQQSVEGILRHRLIVPPQSLGNNSIPAGSRLQSPP